jgi:RimJ/RimL family protein N-acetyltransferase
VLSDAVHIYPQINDADIVRWTTRIPHPYPPGAAEKFIRRTQRQWLQGTSFVFGIISRESDKLIGVISLGNVSLEHGCAEAGFWIGREHWGKGIMSEVLPTVLEFGFEELGLYRIYASTFEANGASRKVLEKWGFQLEGVMREAVIREGRRQNFLNYGLLRPEFEAQKT